MPSDPDPLNPESNDILNSSPIGDSLSWTPWVPFTADKQEFRQIPVEPGLYRIRPVGEEFFMYIGETRTSLFKRLNDLRMELRGGNLMPWADPHAESACLWAWQDAEGFAYECSAASLDATANGRMGMEAYLLYQYRQERSESPLCNFGRFHPRYRSSSRRSGNLRGGKLEDGQKDNPAGNPSQPPLSPVGKPGEPGWMGLTWSGPEILAPEKTPATPAGPCLYILSDTGAGEIIAIGQSMDCAHRLADLTRIPGDERILQVSVHCREKTIFPHQLRELETDLIGNYFGEYRKSPAGQFNR
ncbi:MAG: hypothetical protein ACYDDV_01945 [Methanoregula sp.]